jgi:hypothetical protein
MTVAAAVVSCLLAAVLVMSAAAKLAAIPTVVANMAKVGVAADQLWPLAVLEIAGAVGLVAGLFWTPIGVAAAVGVILYFAGALVFHYRARDSAVVPPSALLLVAVAALALGVAAI